jgi:P-type Mg2+ transporter
MCMSGSLQPDARVEATPEPTRAAGEPTGLTTAQADAELRRSGPNEIESGERFRLIREGLGMLGSPLVLILIVAAIISGVLGDRVDAAIIIAIVLLSVALDFFQVYRSDRAATQLKNLVVATARIWRDGRIIEIPVRDVVPGDVLELRAGALVCADATLLTTGTLTVDQAALTGESLPVERRGGTDPQTAQIFAGTSVVSGVSQACVTATGPRTQFGAIAHSLSQKAPPTEYERGARSFSLVITRTVIALVLFVFLVNALRAQDPLQSFTFALALAVGLTPEFLPMITTVTLSIGAQRMAEQKVIVRRLEAIENLGNMDMLCSDKTGTLTLGTATVQAQVDAAGHDSPDVLRWAAINSAFQTGMQNTLDAAILSAAHVSTAEYRKLAEAPFDFERRRVSVLITGPDGMQLVTKGSPEAVIAVCTAVRSAGGAAPLPLTDHVRQQLETTLDGLSQNGYQTLAVARKPVAAGSTSLTAKDERDLTLDGFVAFLDPPDPSVSAALAQLSASGVSVKILSGDSELVTRTVCQRVGLPHDRVVVGDEVDKMSDAALWANAESINAFARMSPTQKNRVIRALKHRGHVVGYLGDGINDAPSLHAADVGISVSNGVEVAKAAADIILMQKSLAVIHAGVTEGRKSFGNITKYVLMGTGSNFGNVLSMALASAVLPFLPMLPAQILLNNFLYDLSQLTIPTDSVDASYTLRPRKWDASLVQRFMFGMGPISSVFDFLTFGIMLFILNAGPQLFRAGWFIESLATQTLVILVLRTAGNPFKSRPSTPLVLTVVGSVAAGLVVVLSPLGALIGFDPLPAGFFAALVALVAVYLLIVQAVKRRFYAASGWSATT